MYTGSICSGSQAGTECKALPTRQQQHLEHNAEQRILVHERMSHGPVTKF
jgi:hypothetical protein